jgi:hypothetical protein
VPHVCPYPELGLDDTVDAWARNPVPRRTVGYS